MASPKISDFPKVWYVSVNGDDTTGDGTKEKPFATLKKAIESAASGDGIFISRGTYRLVPWKMDSTYRHVGIHDQGKALTIWGENDKTILEWYGSDSTVRDGNLFEIANSETVISNLTFHFYPAKGSNYSNAIFRWCKGIFRNLLIINKSTTTAWSYSYYNNGPANKPVVYNCIFKSNGRSTGDYSGSPLYVNCLFDKTPSGGVKQYCLTRSITDNDWNKLKAPSDLIDKGNPSILDPDGTISDIGVIGGLYAWTFSKILIFHNGNYKTWDITNHVWKTISDILPTQQQFIDEGINDLSILDRQNGYSPLDELDGEFEVVVWTDQQDITGSLKVIAIPPDQIIIPTGDISLYSVESIDSFTISAVVSGLADLRIAVSFDRGVNWYTRSEDGTTWETINLDTTEMKTKGMTKDIFNAIPSDAWNELRNNSGTVRFAYFLSMEESTDILEVDALISQMDMKGSWKKAIHGTHYDYDYPDNNVLRINIYADGDYKINY